MKYFVICRVLGYSLRVLAVIKYYMEGGYTRVRHRLIGEHESDNN